MEVAKDIVKKFFSGINFKDILNDLIKEIEMRNYMITRISNIDNILDRSNSGTGTYVKFRYYKIVEFCNLESCSQLISSDLLAGVFMPLRFVVYQRLEDDKIYIAFLKPTAFANLFNSKKIKDLAGILEKDMHDVLEEIVF